MKSLLLFPTTVFHTDLDTTLNPTLLHTIKELQASDPGVHKSNDKGWHSNDFVLLQHPNFLPLINTIKQQLQLVLSELKWEINLSICNCWVTVTPSRGSNKSHTHPGALFSGVYYIKADEKSSPLVLQDPRSAKVYSNPQISHTALTADKISLTPKAGRLFVFPGWLSHYVPANMSNEDRVVFSFNSILK